MSTKVVWRLDENKKEPPQMRWLGWLALLALTIPMPAMLAVNIQESFDSLGPLLAHVDGQKEWLAATVTVENQQIDQTPDQNYR